MLPRGSQRSFFYPQLFFKSFSPSFVSLFLILFQQHLPFPLQTVERNIPSRPPHPSSALQISNQLRQSKTHKTIRYRFVVLSLSRLSRLSREMQLEYRAPFPPAPLPPPNKNDKTIPITHQYHRFCSFFFFRRVWLRWL